MRYAEKMDLNLQSDRLGDRKVGVDMRKSSLSPFLLLSIVEGGDVGCLSSRVSGSIREQRVLFSNKADFRQGMYEFSLHP